MDLFWQIITVVALIYAVYRIGLEALVILNKKMFDKPGTTNLKETKMRVSGDAQADIIEVLNKHEMTDEQVLSTLIYLAGISVATTGAERVFVEDHARRKKYTMTVEDAQNVTPSN